MSLEQKITDVINKKLEEGIVEKLIAEQLEAGITNALKSLLGGYGDALTEATRRYLSKFKKLTLFTI